MKFIKSDDFDDDDFLEKHPIDLSKYEIFYKLNFCKIIYKKRIYLSKDEEFLLFKLMNYFKYKNKLKEVEVIRNYLINLNLILIDKCLKKFKLIDKEDCFEGNTLNKKRIKLINLIERFFSDGVLGLISAVDGFKYHLGNRFCTFACTCIFNYIAKNNIVKKNNFFTTLEKKDSIDKYEDKYNFDKSSEHKEKIELIKRIVDSISDSKRKSIIILYYLENKTLNEISEIFKCSNQNISLIKNKTLKEIKENFKNDIYFDGD